MLRLKQLLYVCCLALVGMMPWSVLAIGQVTDPIVIDDALRGEEFQEEVIIMNTQDKDIQAGLSAEGQIAEWAKFYNIDDPKTPVDSVSLAAGARLNMYVRFAIPQDVANGQYTGMIGVSEKPATTEGQTETGSTLTQRIDREVTINVSDQEKINITASVIPAGYDLKAGDPLKIRVIYDNQSNISVAPQIDFKIKNGDEVVYNVIFPFPENTDKIKPLAQYEIPELEVATDKLSAGKYLVEMNILQNGQTVTNNDFDLNITAGLSSLSVSIFVIIAIVVVAAGVIISRRRIGRGQLSDKE